MHDTGGKIRGTESDLTYDSHMTVRGDVLDVEGCVTILCSGQGWQRVK